MRVSFLPIALAAAPVVVSAAGSLGWALGAKNADGSCKSTTDYEADFDALKGSSSLVRVYAASQCNTSAEIIPACKSKDFKVMLGVW
jgi:glucan 1,3-beta-glucosidase